MKVVIATPLYPPDIADPAPYVKELARRLSGKHEVTVVTYGHIPETVEGVRMITVDKRNPTMVRLFEFTKALRRAARDADVVYVQSGISAELPALFVAHRKVFRATDTPQGLLRSLIRALSLRTAKSVQNSPPPKPEILPLEPYPGEELKKYEVAWQNHIAALPL